MNGGIKIVSVGSGDPELLNFKTVHSLKNAEILFLRTSRHPIVSWLVKNNIHFSSFDSFYDQAENFEDLSFRIASCLISQSESASVVYAVPDAVTDSSVKALYRLSEGKTEVSVIPGVGTSDLSLSSSLSFLSESDFTVIPASELLEKGYFDPNCSMLITELDNQLLSGQIKLLLSQMLDDEHEIIYFSAYNQPSGIRLYELDRIQPLDHRSALLIPSSGYLSRSRFVMHDLISIMNRLLSPEGCPWDRSQTHDSLRPYLIEEAWESVASIDENDMEHFSEELGDLLFQIIFHSAIGQLYDEFTWNDVVSAICLKMIRRHPHVFSDRSVSGTEEIHSVWEQIKQTESGHATVLDCLNDVSPSLPALKYASQVLKKMKRIDALRRKPDIILSDIINVISRIRKSGSENSIQSALGLLLFLCAELCSAYNTDSEFILHQTVDSWIKRLRKLDKDLQDHGKSLEHLTFHELGVYLQYVEGEIE